VSPTSTEARNWSRAELEKECSERKEKPEYETAHDDEEEHEEDEGE